MTSIYERRIRRLEVHHGSAGSSMLVLGIPGRPEPSAEEISQASHILRVIFVTAKDGRLVNKTGPGGCHEH